MKFLLSVALVCLLKFTAGAEDIVPKADNTNEKLFHASSGSEDLETSATGYLIRRNGNGQGQLFNIGGLSSGLSSGYNYGSPLRNVGSFGGGEFGGSRGLRHFSGSSGFDFPTKYSAGTITGGGLGSSAYSSDPLENYASLNDVGSGIDGLSYGGGLGNLGVGHFSQGNTGYGISKNGLGLAGLGSGAGLHSLGSGVIQTGGLQGGPNGVGGLGYGGIGGGVGLGHGAYIPATGSLAGLGQASIGGIADESSYNKGEAANFHSGQETAEGGEGSKGYKVAEGFDKGEKGKVDKEQESGVYSSAGGEKKGEAEEGKKYAESTAAAGGEKGESFSKSEGHKKGHKTSGFHNVYHKDEFKKDTSFYDSDHASGQEESYGSEDAHHNAAEGAYEKAEKSDAAHNEGSQAKEGSFTNGHQYGAVQGHDREEGEKEHYDNEIEYSKKLGQNGGKQYGQSAGDYVKKIY